MNTNLVSYYKLRAKEYENIYLKPERQADLEGATTILHKIFINKNILEIGCGTGYWTEKLAATAMSVLATDINEPVIEIAKNKSYGKADVTFAIADFYKYPAGKKYEGLFGGFTWSHILLQDLQTFLLKINNLVVPGGTVVFMDNIYVEGSNLPVIKTDAQGNTFQTRKLQDGTSHLVLKNFPSQDFIMGLLKNLAKDIQFISLQYYWIVKYTPL